MQDFTTPMMKQYEAIKSQYQDCLLFYRMGDFYELFLEDAFIGSQVLNITLTSRPKGKDGRIPMAGVPYHAVDSYLTKLVNAGFKVAICEQVSLPSKYGIIDREVVRIVTPGTILDEKSLDKKQNNFLISLLVEDNILSITAADISTGYFATKEIEFKDLSSVIKDELARLNPVECILPEDLYNNPEILKILKSQTGLNIYPFFEWDNFANQAQNLLRDHFKVSTLAGFGLEDKPISLKTLAALLGYLKTTQKSNISHIKKITTLSSDQYLLLDRASIVNLELFSTIREHDVRGSLLFILDQTITPMGGRLLKQWMLKPLTQKETILSRYEAIDEFLANQPFQDQMRELLKLIPDLERILSRMSVGLGNARDLVNIKNTLISIVEIKSQLKNSKSQLLHNLFTTISDDLSQVINIIETQIMDEPPIDLKIGGLIKPGIDKKLDELRSKVGSSKQWLVELEAQEKERTGISSLKVRFNKVFGFYIEVSKSNLNSIPDNYLRKQTLVNGERFITPELKLQEEIILSAEEKIMDIEYQLFLKVQEQVLVFTDKLQDAAGAIAILDCILNFSYLAVKNNYIRPKLLFSGEIKIKGGRHPVVEKLLEGNQFVPNDLTLDNTNSQMLLITGPNMAGKSVYLRQVALIVLMAQIGCFVPATSAYLSIVDRIFVRSGASDVITSGLSTFMVEMVETAYILNQATKNSLIIMDEIGRGTSTYDGISIAWAIAEHLVISNKLAPKTLFATHYHELQQLEKKYPQSIKNYSMSVTEADGEPVFLHTIQKGGASSSFGIVVAKMAGIPDQVIEAALEKLKTLEQTPQSVSSQPTKLTPSTQDLLMESLLQKELENLDIHQMTPLDALNKLAEIKDKLKLIHSQSDKYLEVN